MYLITYEYAAKTSLGILIKKITTRTFRHDELEHIQNNIETYDNYIKILSVHKLR